MENAIEKLYFSYLNDEEECRISNAPKEKAAAEASEKVDATVAGLALETEAASAVFDAVAEYANAINEAGFYAGFKAALSIIQALGK